MPDTISDKLAAIAQPLAEDFPCLIVHQAIPLRNVTSNGDNRTMQARAAANKINIFSIGVDWDHVSLKANSVKILRRNGRVPKETRRNSRARNPKHPHKNFLSLSILWPYRSESELAGAFLHASRLSVIILPALTCGIVRLSHASKSQQFRSRYQASPAPS